VAEELRRLVSPLWDDLFAINEARDIPEKLAAAQRLVARNLPTVIFGYPPALREAANAPPNLDGTADLVAKTIDSRTGFRPPDAGAYTASIVDCLIRRKFGPAVVRRGCEIIRETNPAEFHHQLPSEFHFAAACEGAQREFESVASVIDRAAKALAWAQDLARRAPEIEAEVRESEQLRSPQTRLPAPELTTPARSPQETTAAIHAHRESLSPALRAQLDHVARRFESVVTSDPESEDEVDDAAPPA
jgi:hypothetical protein